MLELFLLLGEFECCIKTQTLLYITLFNWRAFIYFLNFKSTKRLSITINDAHVHISALTLPHSVNKSKILSLNQ